MNYYIRTAVLASTLLPSCQQPQSTSLHLNNYSAISDEQGKINCITQPAESGMETIFARKDFPCPNISDKTKPLTQKLEDMFNNVHSDYVALDNYIIAKRKK